MGFVKFIEDEKADVVELLRYCSSLSNYDADDKSGAAWPGGMEPDQCEYCASCGEVIEHGLTECTCDQRDSSFQVGDIASCTWGYSMILVDFYIVEKRTKANVWFKPIGSDIVNPDEWGQSGYKVPNLSTSGETFRRKIKVYRGEEYTLSGDGKESSIRKWDGTPQRWDTYD